MSNTKEPALDLDFSATCPIPIAQYPQVTLAHGSGGKLTHQLIGKMFAPAFHNAQLDAAHDGATFGVGGAALAFTTDSFVVRPLFFPGGDIGKLAVYGTVNDLAMCGARPLYLSAGFIIEEGLPMEALWRIVRSMQDAAAVAGVSIVTGDTKVVDKGKGDGLFINTAGIGQVVAPAPVGPVSVRPGDAILLSGDVGRHGIAIMAQREGLEFESAIESDCAPLAAPVLALIEAGVRISCLRDLTRGGLATTMVEIARTAAMHIELDERAIAVREDVAGACEILGLDPLYVANEGRFCAFVHPDDAGRALDILRQSTPDQEPARIGQVLAPEEAGYVTLRSRIGARRVLDMLTGEQLPRIC